MQKHTTWRDELDPIDTGMEDKTVEVYLAADVDARIAELEKALLEIKTEAGSHTVCLSVKPQPGAGHVYIYDIASKALMVRVTK